MKFLTLKQWLMSIVLIAFIAPLHAGVAVIVNPDNNQQLDPKQVRSIYLGKLRSFRNGDEIRPYDLPANSTDWNRFVEKVLRKTPSTLNAYWARMLFSSKGKPPRTMDSELEVLNEVASRKNAIGYINSNLVDNSVRVLFVID